MPGPMPPGMPRGQALLTLVLSTAFVALGIFLLINGTADNRMLALGCIAFFGAGIIVSGLRLLPEAKAKLDADGGLTLLANRTQIIGLGIGGAVMGAGCYGLGEFARQDGATTIMYLCYFGAAFFGLALFVSLWRIARIGPIGRIDAEGVRAFGRDGWALAWRDIIAISADQVGGGQMLVFETSALERLYAPQYTLPLWEARLPSEDVYALALALWERHRAG